MSNAPDLGALIGRLDAIVVTARAATLELTFVAGGALERLGWSTREWLEDPRFLVDKLAGDGREMVLTALHAVAADGKPRTVEHGLFARDGSVRRFRSEVNAIDGGALLALMIDTTAAHETARALRETEARLRQVIEKAPLFLFALDREGRFTLVEGHGLRQLHLQPDELIGRSALELMKGEETVPGHIRRALAGEELIALDYVRLFDSWWETRWTPLLDEHGRVSGATAVSLEVSARYRAETELARTISLLRATLEAATDGILVVDTAGNVIDYNRRFVEMWNIPDEILASGDDARSLAFVVDQVRDPDGFLAKVRALYAEPDAVSHDLIEFSDGRIVMRDSQPQRVEGRCVGRVWSFRDVTAEHRATRRAAFLAEASKMLGTRLADETPLEAVARLSVPYLGDWCGILLYDEGQRLYCAAAHHADTSLLPLMYHMQLDEIHPSSGLGRIVLDGQQVAFNDLNDAELSGQPSPRRAVTTSDLDRLALLRRMGLRNWMGVPLLMRGRVIGCLLFGTREGQRRYEPADLETASDLAQRASLALENQQLYRGMQQAVEARDEFLSVASHELRTPVTSLQLAVQSALSVGLESVEADSFLRHALESAERQTRRLGRLVDALLDVSRIEAGRLELAREPIDLALLVREVVRGLSADLRRAGCEVTLDLPEQLTAQWDRARLEQVVTNLVSNAFKYGAGKPIDIGLQRDDGLARLAVRDRGMGVPESERDRIFQRFERAVSARHYGGLGLGLYIVRRIIDAHGGRVSVSSPDSGEGAVFTVELPIVAAP